MDMIGRIRRLHLRDKLSEREIARMTGLSRNTVSNCLRSWAAWQAVPCRTPNSTASGRRVAFRST